MHTAMLEYLGDPAAGTIAMLHATGFCKETWGPVVDELRRIGVEHSIVVWDQPGHGETPLAEAGVDWWISAQEVLEVVGGRPRPLTGVGHSSGGAGIAMAEILRPGTFDSMILMEPIIPPPPHEAFEGGLIDMALRRRDEFASPAEAATKLEGKGAFSGWDQRTLDSYIAGALFEKEGVWRLRCRPDIEAEYYRTAGLHEAWDRLGEVEVPVHLVAGEHSNTHTAEFLELQSSQFQTAATEILLGLGHLFVMQDPAVTAQVIAQQLRIGGNGTDPPD